MAPNTHHVSGIESVKEGSESSAKSENRKANNTVPIELEGEKHEGGHFSSILFSGDITATVLELTVLSFVGSLALLYGETLDVVGSMTFREVTYLLILKS